MDQTQSSYRSIIKSTSIFGGVQVLTILISIIRSKLIAVFLVVRGMGVIGLFNTTIALISGISNCGLGISAVRDVSAANSTNNQNSVEIIVAVIRRWVWITGALGALIVIVSAPWLSKIAFGNNEYIYSFVLISITLLFNQLNVGQLVVMQGLQKIKYLAKASLFGSILGLLFSMPLYLLFGKQGIVPSLIISSFISYIISWYFAKKIELKKRKVSYKVAFLEGKSMLKSGFVISISGLLLTFTTYLLQLFIRNEGGVDQVGLFTAGFAIVNVYVGMVFTAMSTDYFPRLSAISDSNIACKNTINQQAEISILILGPIIVAFLIFMKLIIIVLYSNKFAGIEEMLLWLAIATFFKAGSWAIAFLLLAKGASKLFFWNELAANIYVLILNISGYYFFGLTGLGIASIIAYVIYFIQVFLVCKLKYDFSLDKTFLKTFIIQFALATICVFAIKLTTTPYSHGIGAVLLMLSIVHSYQELNKKLNIKEFFKNYKKLKS